MLFISPSASTIPSIKLALASAPLQMHIFLLSATATLGLLVLFHVIATYGALIAGLIMTIRQFVSVICNAVWFGNMTNISLSGWAGIGLVAAGIWIKMDRRYDAPTEEKEASEMIERPNRIRSWFRQFIIPVTVCPIIFVFLISAIAFVSGVSQASFAQPVTLSKPSGHISESGNPYDDRMLDILNPDCPGGPLNSVKYNTTVRTAIATYPRSGSSYTR